MYLHNKSLVRPWARAAVLAMVAAQSLPAVAEQTRDHTIFALEHALIGVGYQLNPVDGVMDPVTEEALRDYQSSHPGLVPTGKVDDATLMALGIMTPNANSQAQPEKTASTAAAATTDTDAPATQPDTSETNQEKSEGRRWLFF